MGQSKDCCGCAYYFAHMLSHKAERHMLSHKAEHTFDEINLSEKLEYYEIMIILIGKGYAYSLLQK